MFTNERGFPITLEQLDAQYDYMVLREVGAPAGYRHPGDMHLRFENGVLLSTNEWDTGAWSQAKLTATATDPIRIDNGDGTVGVVDPSGGTMFAVIMKRRSMSAPVDDLANWAPVSGDALAGWQVGADNSLASIVQAVRATPYPFALGTNGAYQVEVDNLPGDVNQYYGMLANNGEDTSGAQYTVQYYYVAGSGGADGASARTIHRILTEPDAGYAGFSYAYSVRLYIANIRNGFLVAKTDTAGNPLAGATFALYRRADMVDVTDSDTSDTTGAAWTVRGPDGNGTVTLGVAPGVSPVDEATTGDDGGVAFPTAGHTLDPGDYVLVETAAPDGYVANARAVPVVVNDQGVFADAGVADDGVRVDLGVGYLVRSMVQFAADDDIDATLHDVTAALQTSATAPGESRRLAVDRRDHASALRGRRQSAVRSGRDGIPADVGSGCGVVASDGDAVHGTQHGQQPQAESGRTGPEQPVHRVRNRARRRPPRRRGGTRPARRPDRSFGSFGSV